MSNYDLAYNAHPQMLLDIDIYPVRKKTTEVTNILYVRGDIIPDVYKRLLVRYEQLCFGKKNQEVPTTGTTCPAISDTYPIYTFAVSVTPELLELINTYVLPPLTQNVRDTFLRSRLIQIETAQDQVLQLVFNSAYRAHMRVSLDFAGRSVNLFSVCIHNLEFQGKGYASLMFKSVQARIDKGAFDRMWLGVLLNNPSFTSAVGLYASQQLTIIDKQDLCELNGQPYIEMEWRPQHSGISVDDMVKKAKAIRKNYLKEHASWCKQYVYMDPQMALCLQTYQRNPLIEWAGRLLIVESTVADDIHILAPADLTSGTGNQVNPPLSAINFHVHPEVCYRKNVCDSGWPSGNDAYAVLEIAKLKNLAHLVITREGVYIMKVNPFFFDVATQDQWTFAKDVSKMYYTLLENGRDATLQSLSPRDKINWFLSMTAHVSLEQMVESVVYKVDSTEYKVVNAMKGLPSHYASSKNMVPLLVQFVEWKEIEVQGGMIFEVYFKADSGGVCKAKQDATSIGAPMCLAYKDADMENVFVPGGGNRRVEKKLKKR